MIYVNKYSIDDAVEYVIENSRNNKHRIEYNGESYISLLEVCNKFNIDYNLVYYRLNHYKCMLTEALDMAIEDKEKRKVRYYKIFGKLISNNGTFMSLRMNYNCIAYRTSNGAEVTVAFIVDRCTKLKLDFITLDGIAYYKVGTDRLTTRQIIEKYKPELLQTYDKYNPSGKYEPPEVLELTNAEYKEYLNKQNQTSHS